MSSTREERLTHLARMFVAAVAAGKSREAIEAFYAEDVTQQVYPNLLAPKGTVRDFIQMRAAYDRSRFIIRAQTYDVVNTVASGDTVVLEVVWSATLATAAGRLSAGDSMRARFVQIFEFRDEKIVRIRNYDCFDPLESAASPE